MKKINTLCALLLIMATNSSTIQGMEAASENTLKKERMRLQLVSATDDLPDSLVQSVISNEYRIPASPLFGPLSGDALVLENAKKELWNIAKEDLKNFSIQYKPKGSSRLGIILCQVLPISLSTLEKVCEESAKRSPAFSVEWNQFSPEQKSDLIKAIRNISGAVPIAVPIEYLIGKKENEIIMYRGKAKANSSYGSIHPRDLLQEKTFHSAEENDPDFEEDSTHEFVATKEFCDAVNKLMILTQNTYKVGNELISGKPIMDTK